MISCLFTTSPYPVYTVKNVIEMIGTQAFVSEYAVWRSDAGRGSLLASLAEAAFLTGLEKNR
jgi:hypothetical protein